VKVEKVCYGDNDLRLVWMENRWWIYAEDAAAQDGPAKQTFYDGAPESERRLLSLAAGLPTRLVSTRHLVALLEETSNDRLARLSSGALQCFNLIKPSPHPAVVEFA
jgi:hypothetical protein